MATPVEFANQSTYSHPEVQKFKPTALRMAKALESLPIYLPFGAISVDRKKIELRLTVLLFY